MKLYNLNSATETISCLDINENGYSLRIYEKNKFSTLKLSSLFSSNPENSFSVIEYLDLKEIISLLSIIANSTTLIIGTTEDPFSASPKKINLSLQLLKNLSSINLKKCIIQTASPLILLATPMIKTINASVTMREDSTSGTKRLANSTRSCECLDALIALKSVGIKVSMCHSKAIEQNLEDTIIEIAA